MPDSIQSVDGPGSIPSVDAPDSIQLMELDSGELGREADDLDALIKPLRIMRTARV